MIFKCEECSHLFEIPDPAIGWQASLNVEACPHCGMPGRKSEGQVRLVAALLTIQFISAAYLAAEQLFDFGNPAGLHAAALLVTTLWLSILNNQKGHPIVLRRKKDAAVAKP